MECITRFGELVEDPHWNRAARKDLFFRAEAFQILYGNNWTSVTFRDGGRSFTHAYARSTIADTGLCDIEPFMGYSGPIVSTDDPGFLREALDAYSGHCRSRGIVAELIRFNPILGNHRPFVKISPRLKVIEAKPLLYTNLSGEDPQLFAQYEPRCRNMVQVARRSCTTRWLARPDGLAWDSFLRFYLSTMCRRQAAPEWYFDDAFYERLRSSPLANLIIVYAEDKPIAASVFLLAGKCAYYFLSGSSEEARQCRGATNLLVHHAAAECAQSGAASLCLGGGVTRERSDSLFLFKRSFSKLQKQLPLGFLAHNPVQLQRLYERAASEEPDNASLPLFMRYRCTERFSAGRMAAVLPCGSRAEREPV